MQGLDNMHSNIAAQSQTEVDPLAELDDMFVLTCTEPEQEPAPVPVSSFCTYTFLRQHSMPEAGADSCQENVSYGCRH